MPSLPAVIYDYSTAHAFQPDMAELFNQVYIGDGWHPTLVWDGYRPEAVRAGIAAPETLDWDAGATSTLPGSASVSPGQHFIRYRFADSKTGFVSNPTEAYQFVAAEGASGTTAGYIMSNIVPSPDSKVDQIHVEMTRVGGGQFLRATTLENESAAVTIRLNDQDLGANLLFWRDFGHGVPPRTRFIESFRERLWFLGDVIYGEGEAKRKIAGHTTSILGSGTEWTSAAVGRHFIFDGDSVKRLVSSVVSGGELVVEDTVFAGDGQFSTYGAYRIVPVGPDTLYVSQPLFPQSVPTESQLRVLAGRAERATGMRGYRQDLVIFGERSMELFVYTSDPLGDGRRERVEGNRGAATRRCVVDAAGALWALDYKGIHRWTGGISERPQHVSESIDPLFDTSDRSRGYVDFRYASQFHSIHLPLTHQIAWFVVLNGAEGDSATYTSPQHALVFDYMREDWSVLRFDVPMVASTLVPDNNGKLFPVICDENGRAWSYGVGKKDGAPATQDRKVVLASGTSGQILVLASGYSFYASNSGLAGTPLYDESRDRAYIVQSNSAGGATLTESPLSALASGDQLWVGSIRGRWKTGALAFATRKERVQGRYAHLYYEPLESGQAKVRLYRDQSASAYQAFKHSYSNEAVHHSGSGAIDYRIDLDHYDGYARVPIAGGQFTTLEFEVIFSEGGVRPVFTGLTLDGYSEEEDQEP